MGKSILQMVGEKHISPHYAIKSENTSCDISSKGFTGIEFNGVRFSNISEMLRYMDMQRTQIIEAKEIINIATEGIKRWGIVEGSERPFKKQAEMLFNLFLDKSEQFLSEVEE